jgi:hypothetical protein
LPVDWHGHQKIVKIIAQHAHEITGTGREVETSFVEFVEGNNCIFPDVPSCSLSPSCPIFWFGVALLSLSGARCVLNYLGLTRGRHEMNLASHGVE